MVTISGQKSDVGNVTSGVPRTTLLGPLVFLVFVTDLPGRLQVSNSFGNVGDIKIIVSSKQKLQDSVNGIKSWCDENKMTDFS